jgi:hypothetical protein
MQHGVWSTPFGRGKAPAVTEQQCRQAMSGTQQIGAEGLAAPEQIPRRFLLVARNVDGGERASAIPHGELAGVPAVGLNAVSRAPRNERRGDDLTAHAVRREGALQFEATRPGFVAAANRADTPAYAIDKAEYGPTIGRQGVERRGARPRQEHRRDRRGRVLIEGDNGSRLRHDRPPCMRLCPTSPEPARRVTRDSLQAGVGLSILSRTTRGSGLTRRAEHYCINAVPAGDCLYRKE